MIAADYTCPPAVICAVRDETIRSGWPHSATRPEREAIATTVAMLYSNPFGYLTSGICDFPRGTPAVARCRVWWRIGGRVVKRIDTTLLVRSNGRWTER